MDAMIQKTECLLMRGRGFSSFSSSPERQLKKKKVHLSNIRQTGCATVHLKAESLSVLLCLLRD